jgi:hypothetical protein
LEAELDDEDVITDSTESFEENKYGALAIMRSEPVNKIFIEHRSKTNIIFICIKVSPRQIFKLAKPLKFLKINLGTISIVLLITENIFYGFS